MFHPYNFTHTAAGVVIVVAFVVAASDVVAGLAVTLAMVVAVAVIVVSGVVAVVVVVVPLTLPLLLFTAHDWSHNFFSPKFQLGGESSAGFSRKSAALS